MKNLAIIAGKGRLPELIFEKLPEAKIVSVEGNDPENLQPDLTANFGEIGKLIGFLKDNNIEQMVFAGATHKPNLKQLKLDKEGSKLLAKIMAGSLFSKKLPGDNSLLSKILKYFEKNGFQIVGAHEIVPSLLAEKGVIAGKCDDMSDIELGFQAAKALGEKDIGQGVVVHEGKVIAEEDVKGTEDLIARAGELNLKGVLVKCKKPQQEERVDLPSIGPETITQLHKAGLQGVAVEAGSSIILDKDAVIKKADELGIFVIGI